VQAQANILGAHMLEESGIVVSISKDMAEVSVTPQSACGNCGASGGCGTSLIASLFPERSSRFKVKNPLNAQIGEQVTIGLRESALQSASLMLYLIPLAGLIFGAMGGIYLSEHVFHSPSELLSILLGFTGLGAGFILVKYLVQYGRGLGGYQAEIIRIKRIETKRRRHEIQTQF
jgi:sigma-E factor negative regulatory protein RseC